MNSITHRLALPLVLLGLTACPMPHVVGDSPDETSTGDTTGATGGATPGTEPGSGGTAPGTEPGTGDDSTASSSTSTGPDVTTGPGATTEDTETVPETGVVEGSAVVIEDRCGLDDGPALEFKVGVASTDCSAEFPEDAPIITVSLWQGGPLAPGYYELDNGGGFATFDDGNGVQMTTTGTISLIEWDSGFPSGAIELSFPDGPQFKDGFLGIYCPSEPPCK